MNTIAKNPYVGPRTFLKEDKKVADQILKEIRKKFAEEV